MKKFNVLIVGLLITAAVNAQSTNDNLISWNEFYELRWDDFQGKAGKDAIGDAGTVVQIKAQPYMVKKKVKYDVYAFFNKEKSWSRDKSDALLQHEQLHFDLAELYARKIRRKIRELERENVNDVKIYNAAIQEILEESNNADMRYDMETLHGALTKKQIFWKQKIKDELEALKSFKKQKTMISAG